MPAMRIVADEAQVAQLIDKLGEAIMADIASDAKGDPWALVGIRSRGDILAARLAPKLKPDHVGTLDITLYRDDLSEIGSQPVVRTTDVDFNIDRMNIVLVDDVLMTGRSIRAALQSLMDFGRPRRVWLSVLVDRGGRELPIAADHVGLSLAGQVSAADLVDVHLKPSENSDKIVVRSRSESKAAGTP